MIIPEPLEISSQNFSELSCVGHGGGQVPKLLYGCAGGDLISLMFL